MTLRRIRLAGVAIAVQTLAVACALGAREDGAVAAQDAPADPAASDGAPIPELPADGESEVAAADAETAETAPADAEPADTAAAPPTCALVAPATLAAPQLLTSASPGQILANVQDPLLAPLWQQVQQSAAQPLPPVTNYSACTALGNTAKAKALVGWVKGESAAAHQAVAASATLPEPAIALTDPNAGLHVGDGLVGLGVALHLAEAATPSDTQLPQARERLGQWCSAFYQWVTADMAVAYAFWPNNHSEKAAAGLGMCALVLPTHPQAAQWQGWAAATVRDIWHGFAYAPSGSYAEGPYYHMYALLSEIPWLVALHRASPQGVCGQVLCQTRLAWQPQCQDRSEPIADLLTDPLLSASVRWTAAFLRPDGLLWPWGDALPAGFPFGALAGPLQIPEAAWAFVQHPFAAWTADLSVETLLFWDAQLVAKAPVQPWLFLPDGGTAMWRGGPGQDAWQVGMLAVPPAFQWAGHRQADALHVEVFARGKARFLDAGYSKWGDHEKVNKAEQHNTVFVDDKGPVVPALATKTVQPCQLLQGDANGGEAEATLPNALVHRKLALLPDGVVRVTDTFKFVDNQAHSAGLRWQGLGGLTPAEDARGAFTPLADGGRWQDASGAAWVRVTSPTGPLQFTSDLQHDGLAYGVLKQHRSLAVKLTATGTATLQSDLWVGAPGELPPWAKK